MSPFSLCPHFPRVPRSAFRRNSEKPEFRPGSLRSPGNS